MAAATTTTIRVSVACSPRAGEAFEIGIALDAGATAADAIAASGVAVPEAMLSIGIWGRPAARDAPLREGDRVELYRPLAVDPKEARRRRAKEGRKKR